MSDTDDNPHLIKAEPVKAFKDLLESLSGVTSNSDGATFAPVEAALTGARIGNAVVKFLFAFLLLFVRGAIAPLEVLLRTQIGERYFNLLILIASGVTLSAAAMVGVLNQPAAGIIFIILWIGVCIHLAIAFFRDRFGNYWHSYSEGNSWIISVPINQFLYRWRFTMDFSKQILEPLFIFTSGVLLRGFSSEQWQKESLFGANEDARLAPSNYLMIAAVLMFFYQFYCWQCRRKLLLDKKDALVLLKAEQLSSEPTTQPTIRNHCGVAYLPRVEVKKESSVKDKGHPPYQADALRSE